MGRRGRSLRDGVGGGLGRVWVRIKSRWGLLGGWGDSVEESEGLEILAMIGCEE